MGSTGVDVGALRAVAGEYERVADIVGRAVRDQLQQLTFGGSTAGRSYVVHGEALQAALRDLAASASEWCRAAGEIASALDVTVDRYVDADHGAAGRVG
ncbi:ESX-1 secretion-associated protein [Mycolicibacterium sp. 3033]|nr:ESX-1 secretion-associated protein [Mycolicibacterium aurantiacum]